MKYLFYILFLQFFHVLVFSQDSLNFADYHNLEKKENSYVIMDAFKKPYKFFNKKRYAEFVVINKKRQKIDTSIFIDARIVAYKNQITINDALLMNYYHKNINAPKHGGDPNFSIISFVVSSDGHIVQISILENVKNSCDEKWKIKLQKEFKFKPDTLYHTKNYIEYILKIDDICYCECEIIDGEIQTPINN